MAFDPVSAALDIGSKLIDRLWPDPAQRDQAKLELLKMQQTGALAELAAQTELRKGAAEIVKSESASSHWLAANWRPITMMIFVAFIVARWMGWTAPNISQQEYLALWDIVQLGLGGYVIGRSAEKILPSIAEVMKK